jgi:hypothetical protein
VEVYYFFPEVLADLFRFSHDIKQRGNEYVDRYDIHPELHVQMSQIMSISLSEASKAMTLFSGIFQAVLSTVK